MLISGGNFSPAQSVVKAPVRNHRSSDARADTRTAGKRQQDGHANWMWWCTSVTDRLAPTRDGDDLSEIERHNSVSEIYIDFGHRL